MTSDKVRVVSLSGGRVIEVRGSGAYTLWRDPSDNTSHFAGQWVLASPDFTKEIELQEAA